MRVLVTGATGFVGSHLVPFLGRDHEVIALVHRPAPAPQGAAKTIVADLASPSVGTRLPRDIDVIVHLAQAYRTFPDHAAEILAVNTVGTQHLADLARTTGVRRFVFASSGSIYPTSPTPHRESDPVRPLGFHPATKLMAEQVLEYYADPLEVLSLRLFVPYGPGQVDRMIPRMIASVRGGGVVTLSHGGEPRVNPIYIDDLVEILGQAVVGSSEGVVNIAGPSVVSIRDLAEAIGTALGTPPRFEERNEPRRGDLVADTARMHTTFRVGRLIEPAEGIARTVAAGSAHD